MHLLFIAFFTSPIFQLATTGERAYVVVLQPLHRDAEVQNLQLSIFFKIVYH